MTSEANGGKDPADPARSSRQGKRVLLPAGIPTLEQIVNLYRSLTGRDPTPEDLADARQLLEESPSTVPDDLIIEVEAES